METLPLAPATPWLSLVAIVACIALTAFLSLCETVLTVASPARLDQLAEDGSEAARRAVALRGRPATLAGLLTLKTLFTVLAAAEAAALAVPRHGPAGVLYALLGVGVPLVVLSQIFARIYGRHHADRLALPLAPATAFAAGLAQPVSALLALPARGLLRLVGVPAAAAVDTAEQLRGAIALHRGEDGADPEDAEEVRQERAMLRSILDLGEVAVHEIMTHRRNLVTIDADEPPGAIVDAVLGSPFTRLPLWRGTPDNIVGVLHAKALLREVQNRGGALTAADIQAVAAKPWFIPDGTTLLDQLAAFRQRREHFALVVDEYGALQGVVTLEDILEEIVGDIADEHDLAVPGVRPQTNGSYIVDGTVTIRDINRQFEWRLPDDRASTIAGLVLYEARRIPEVGQVFTFYGFRFEILRRQRHQVTSLRLTPPPREPAGRIREPLRR